MHVAVRMCLEVCSMNTKPEKLLRDILPCRVYRELISLCNESCRDGVEVACYIVGSIDHPETIRTTLKHVGTKTLVRRAQLDSTTWARPLIADFHTHLGTTTPSPEDLSFLLYLKKYNVTNTLMGMIIGNPRGIDVGMMLFWQVTDWDKLRQTFTSTGDPKIALEMAGYPHYFTYHSERKCPHLEERW